MRHHGFLAILLASTAAGFAWLFHQDTSLDASEENARSFRQAFGGDSERSEPIEDASGIRLNYFESSWDRVLRNVAEQGQMTLVMDKVPHGKFARRDRKRYEPESAIRVLNSELEPQGFRLMKQGQYLIVLKLDQARTRYARPVLTDWNNSTSSNRPESSTLFQNREKPLQQSHSRNGDGNLRVTWASQQSSPTDSDQPLPPQARKSAFGDLVEPQPNRKTVTPEPRTDDGPVTISTVTMLNAKAADVARSIYLVFESRSELIREGLQGLPTFVVNDQPATETGDKPQPMFRIGIDQANGKLLIEATKTRAGHLSRLITELDKPKIAGNETVKLLPNKGVSNVTAKDLNDQIHRMVAMQSQPPQAQSTRPGEQATAETEGTLNLRGDVNVQAMQELGILILKGNDADVEKVAQIIKQLEEMSVGSLPDIHLLSLQFVNSESMAELLGSVYTQLAELRNRGSESRNKAAFIPVVKPNAILILAPQIDLESILDLADKLDQRTDPESEFEVFSLKHAIASQVAASLTTFFETRGGLGTRIRIVADARTNSVIVQGRPNDLEEVAKVVEKFDRDEPGAVHRVEIVELNHATAAELAEIVNSAIQSVSSPPQQTSVGGLGGANQGAQELRDSKSVALEFLTANGNGRELIRSGILVDVRVNADPRSNSLVISAPETSMPLLLALVRQLDRAPSAIAEIKVFALKNADATQSVELLTTLFENQNQEDQLGVQIAGAEDAVTSLIPVQFSADVRTNTVLAVGGAESLSVVEAILLRLDTTQSRERTTTVIPMRNVEASIVADAVTSFLDQQQALQDSSQDMISNIERLRQEVIIAPDDNSNSLIVSASPEYFSQITQIINELDANPPQVVIQALLVEVQLDNTDEFGIELGFQDPLLFARSLIDTIETVTTTGLDPVTGFTTNSQTVVSANGNPGFGFNNTINALGNNAAGAINPTGVGTAPGTVATQGISNFSLGRQNGNLGFGGFVFSAQSDAVSVLVRALAARRTVHILSRPQIRTTHNNTASIEVGQEIPVVDGVTVTNNFVTPDIVQRNVGIILEVTPRVTADNTIYMDVYAEKSALASGGVPVFTDVTTGNVVESVIIDSAIADTAVAVPNGQTIVIGGMITKSDETLERKVPWLGDLPIVGSAFRYDSTSTARTELLIFLTPRIIYGDVDSELIKQVETERMHFIESEAEEIHGPIFSVPPSELDSYISDPVIDSPGQAIPLGESVPSDPTVIIPPQTRNSADSDRKVASKEFDSGDSPQIIPVSGTTSESRVKSAGGSLPADRTQEKPTSEKKKNVSWFRRMMSAK